jgi:hypothetical protein
MRGIFMSKSRASTVIKGVIGLYHCYSRVVRRAFLFGLDPLTNIDYDYRKKWYQDRLDPSRKGSTTQAQEFSLIKHLE